MDRASLVKMDFTENIVRLSALSIAATQFAISQKGTVFLVNPAFTEKNVNIRVLKTVSRRIARSPLVTAPPALEDFTEVNV